MTPWNDVHRIVCVRLDSLGDLLMTTPALHALRVSQPQRAITLLTSHSAAPLAPFLPMVDDVLTFDAPWMKATQHDSSTAAPEATATIVEQLRNGAFDASVIFTVFSQSPLPAALLCHMAGIPRCLAYCRENPYQLLSHWIPEPEATGAARHEVERQLSLVAEIGSTTTDTRLTVKVPARCLREIDALLTNCSVDLQRPLVVVHPGASAPSRRYPVELFADVVIELQRRELQVILTGTNREVPLVKELQAIIPQAVISLAGKTDLGQMAALLQRASLLVANNTGPVHLSAAVGTPVVDLYALTNPQHGPWQVAHRILSHDVPCRNCYKSICPEGHHDCLRLVKPQQVVQAACELLDGSNGRVSNTSTRDVSSLDASQRPLVVTSHFLGLS